MAWTDSRVFRAFLADAMTRAVLFDIDTDTVNVALYNNTITPDLNAASGALSSYNGTASQWLTANEVFQAGQWAQAGVALASKVVDQATAGVVFYDANDTASGSAATLTNAYGALVYDNTVATNKSGISYNYFGGANSVTNGTFTVVWNANGIWRATL